MTVHRYSRQAERDIDDVLDYFIRKRLVDVGRKMLDLIEKACRSQAEMPFTGTPCDHLKPNLRCTVAGPYSVYYYPKDDGIDVARILHGSRNIVPDMIPDET